MNGESLGQILVISILALNGFEKQIDHRSLADQGIELVPQNVELPSDAKDRLTEQRDRQVAIMRENGEKLKENPEIAFRGITNQQSVFTEKDMARYLNSRTADKQQFDEVFNALKNHEDLVRLADKGGEYLYTTKEILDIERGLFKDARSMSESSGFAVKDKDLAKLDNKDLSTEQKAAVEYICQDKGFRAVVGYAGTGKTHMLSSAKEIWENSGYNVHGATLSGIAAQGLERGSGIESKTVARRLIDWENGRGRLGSKDVLVIDEAGMLGVRDVSRIMKEASGAGAKVVMLGDPQQLQAIEAGAAFRGVVEREGCLEMSNVKRQAVSWQREATKDFAMGKTGDALKAYKSANKLHQFSTKEKAMHIMVKDWEKGRGNGVNRGADRGGEDTSIMLAFRRSDVAELNSMARGVLKAKGDLDSGISVETLNGTREFSKSDQVYFLRNDNGLNVKNGTLGTVKSINDQGDMVVNVKEAACDREVSFNVKDYCHIDHGYAATVHKAQGVTGDKSYVLATRGFNQHLSYVSMSRHVQDVNMYWSKDEFKDYKSLERHLSREATKENALDYMKAAKDFAETRGVASTYKDILVKANNLFVDFKDKVRDTLRSFGRSKEIISSLEERKEFNQSLRRFEGIWGKPITTDLKAGEELSYVGNNKFCNKEYGVFMGKDEITKIVPIDQCQGLRITDDAIIGQNRDGGFVARPTENTLWQRNINDLSQEYGKEVTQGVEAGEMGRCRGVIDKGRESYVIMEQYDKIALVNSRDCSSSFKKNDYMKVEERTRYDAVDDKKHKELSVVHDRDTQKAVEKTQEKTQQMEKSRGMELEI